MRTANGFYDWDAEQAWNAFETNFKIAYFRLAFMFCSAPIKKSAMALDGS